MHDGIWPLTNLCCCTWRLKALHISLGLFCFSFQFENHCLKLKIFNFHMSQKGTLRLSWSGSDDLTTHSRFPWTSNRKRHRETARAFDFQRMIRSLWLFIFHLRLQDKMAITYDFSCFYTQSPKDCSYNINKGLSTYFCKSQTGSCRAWCRR